MVGVDAAYQFQAVAVRQMHVCQTQIKSVRGQQIGCGADVFGRHRVDIHAAERDLQQFADVRFIVNDQCELGHRRSLKKKS